MYLSDIPARLTTILDRNDEIDVMSILHGDLTSMQHSETYLKFLQSRAESMSPLFKKFIYTYLCCPIEHVQFIPEVQNLMNNTVFVNRPDFLIAKEEVSVELRNQTILEYFQFLLSTQPVFQVSCNYLTRFQSLELVKNWIDYQFEGEAVNFMETLFNVLTRSVKKKTIFLYGPPDSGKTFMIKTVYDLFINVGVLGVLHNSRFAFAPLAGARIVFWDEPKWDLIHKNSLKLMLSGGHLSIEEKQKKQQIVFGLPVIICSNPDTIFDWNDPIWTSRIYRFSVKKLNCPLFTEQIHPLAFLDLFAEHHLI